MIKETNTAISISLMNFILFRKYRVVVLCAFGLKASGTKDLLGVPCSLPRLQREVVWTADSYYPS